MRAPPFDSQRSVPSPMGPITIAAQDGVITSVKWGGTGSDESDVLCDAEAQLTAYFAGNLTRFDLPMVVHGSDTQRRACAAMLAIPFGETKTYGDLAKDLDLSAQAMGQLCGNNPIPILIPCHRVLGANGLCGFSGGRGVEDKVWLLRHEGAAGLLI